MKWRRKGSGKRPGKIKKSIYTEKLPAAVPDMVLLPFQSRESEEEIGVKDHERQKEASGQAGCLFLQEYPERKRENVFFEKELVHSSLSPSILDLETMTFSS